MCAAMHILNDVGEVDIAMPLVVTRMAVMLVWRCSPDPGHGDDDHDSVGAADDVHDDIILNVLAFAARGSFDIVLFTQLTTSTRLQAGIMLLRAVGTSPWERACRCLSSQASRAQPR